MVVSAIDKCPELSTKLTLLMSIASFIIYVARSEYR